MRQSKKALTVEKKIKGHKRHIVVDIEGHLLAVKVHAANRHDSTSGGEVLAQAVKKYPRLKAFSADAGYRKTCKEYCEKELQRPLHISTKIKDSFAILPKRWLVERTFAWFGNFRRLAKDFEKRIIYAENIIRIAMIHITLRKIS